MDVDPNFHEKADIYQMWTFTKIKGWLALARFIVGKLPNGAGMNIHLMCRADFRFRKLA